MGRNATQNTALLGLFLASGCAALIYEIVWFQQLSLVLGASAVSLAILLASFMGGMCLGSLGFSSWVSTRHHPLRVYALLELMIGLCGVATLWLFPIVGRVYCNLSLAGSSDLFARSLVAMVLMLPPTAMMGATLPAISRWVDSNRSGMAWLGWFYGANTFGAVIGSLLAGMYLLRQYDLFVATCVAATINAGIAVVAFQLARFDLTIPSFNADEKRFPAIDGSRRFGMIHLAIALSGMTALGAEVIWTRHLGLLLGPTVYTFSIILAVYLLGLGLGSGAGAMIGCRVRSPRLALAVTQLLLTAAIPYAAYMIVRVVPFWMVLHGSDELFTVRLSRDVIRTMVTLLPATCLWGASFPLAVASMTGNGRDPGRIVGHLYAANTLGAIVGALGVSLFAIPYGGQFVQQMLTVICGITGALTLVTVEWRSRDPSKGLEVEPQLAKRSTAISFVAGIASVIVSIVCSCAGFNRVPAVPDSLLADGRYMDPAATYCNYIYVAEGLDSPIVVSEREDGTRYFHVAGKIEASTQFRDVRTQRMLGHLPAMAHPLPKKVLVVGCGSGMTAGSFWLHPSVEQVVLCEMEKRVIEASRDNFADQNYGVLRDPRTRIVYDDARHFLATTRETFDIITTDPIHPWVKGAATLYTSEFFQLCKSHLNPDGVMTLWVPLYESNEATVKCEMATFLQEFPETTIWSGESLHVGYDLVVVGWTNRAPIDVDKMISKLSSNRTLQASFQEVGLGTEEALFNRFAASGDDLHDWLQGAQINRDCNLRLQYLAGTDPSGAMEQSIIKAMTSKFHRPRASVPNEDAP